MSCNAAKNPIPLDFSWSGTAAAAYIAVGATSDPKTTGQGWTLPPTGTQANFPHDGNDINFPCNQASATFTLGVYDNNDNKVVKQLVVTNTGTVNERRHPGRKLFRSQPGTSPTTRCRAYRTGAPP